MENSGTSAGAAVASAKPPVFFARKKLVEGALERWPSRTLAQILERLQQTVLETRRRPDLAVALAHEALTQIAISARRPR
jgi:DNA polymerase-3 subunit delta